MEFINGTQINTPYILGSDTITSMVTPYGDRTVIASPSGISEFNASGKRLGPNTKKQKQQAQQNWDLIKSLFGNNFDRAEIGSGPIPVVSILGSGPVPVGQQNPSVKSFGGNINYLNYFLRYGSYKH